jgi:hypothetical protein
MTPSHLPAKIIINLTKIPRKTFYNRATSREVRFIEMFRSDRLYDVKDWNKKNSDYIVKM